MTEKTELKEIEEELNKIWDVANMMRWIGEATSGKEIGGLCAVSSVILEHICQARFLVDKLKERDDKKAVSTIKK